MSSESPNESLYHVVYTSRSIRPIDSALMTSILVVARERNGKDGITGFLATRDGYFFQLLEGPMDKVKACLSRILKDSRHSSVVLHAEVMSQERMMKNWSMAQVELSSGSDSSESLIELIECARDGAVYKHKTSILAMLKKFTLNAKPIDS